MHQFAHENKVDKLRALLDAEPGLLEAPDGWLGRALRPLHYACYNGSLEAAQLLLLRGADLRCKDSNGCTPLLLACQAGRSAVVSVLLARGADPADGDAERRAALVHACLGAELPGSDHVAVVRLLLTHAQVSVDARDRAGRTALWWACYEGHGERVRVLLREGRADHTIVSRRGETAINTAVSFEKKGCVQVLMVRAPVDVITGCWLACPRNSSTSMPDSHTRGSTCVSFSCSAGISPTV